LVGENKWEIAGKSSGEDEKIIILEFKRKRGEKSFSSGKKLKFGSGKP
jgi:hypothetical protein